MKSIISNKPYCLVCGSPQHLHRHHIYPGYGRRQLSDDYGCWVYLCARHHNMTDFSVHRDSRLDLMLKQQGQKAWEKQFGTREDFIKVFGRSWL